ncbi:MAG: OmpA family protein [Saprospiraceae bacterium]|nr:OmpA family protein [Saprospiraceae bacterium]
MTKPLKEENLMFADTAHRQEHRWEIGLLLGANYTLGDLSNDVSFYPEDIKPALGFMVRKHVLPSLAIRANLISALTGSQDQRYPERNFSYKGNLNELSLQAEWEPFGRRRFRHKDTVHYQLDNYRQISTVNRMRHRLSPYLFVGGGAIMSKATADFNEKFVSENGISDRVKKDKEDGANWQTQLGISLGAGTHLDLGKDLVISGEVGIRKANSDYLDGISQAGYAENQDWYFIGGITLSKRIGWRDRDGDGIADKMDKCPSLPGSGDTNGCPDTDHDGIADKDDECPLRRGVPALSGCPMKDADRDSVPDMDDLCPNVFGLVKFKGCPDTDGDGIEDRADSCHLVAGIMQFHGCPDTDGDGIEDKKDACPTEKGPLEYYFGCPVRDTDRDSVEDRYDECLLVAGKVKFKGCPDTDNDGIEDKYDSCPTRPGTAANKGCPGIDKKDKEKLDLAVKSVKFETGKAILKVESNKILNDIADIMTRYPEYKLRIEGHTDNQGKDEANLTLSEKRAVACAEYLTGKGVNKTRMLPKGFGETKPVADNKTAAGRTKNRRVEFILSLD